MTVDKKDEVKAALDIVDLIGETVTLKRGLNGEYTGATSSLSKSGASLHVDSKTGVWNDFSGRANPSGGDVFSWIAYEKNLDIKTDFRQILTIAAEKAGIPLEELTEKQIQQIEERETVQECLTKAAGAFHANLTPEIREYINKKWGINNDTIDRLKIGYARPDKNSNLRSLGLDDDWLKTGLFTVRQLTEKRADGLTQQAYEFFKGRVVFPYWNNGKVVNFAARGDFNNPINTPDNIYEKKENGDIIKYKKLLTHSEDREYISECVNNSYVWGTDTLKRNDYCIITEGIADAIVLMQNDYPVLSPVTTSFPKHDNEKLLKAAKRLKTVYICNDNEDSGAGENGALRTGKLLKSEGIDVKIMMLPKENLDKMDVAEYFLKHNKDEFNEIIKDSEDVLVHLLHKVKISDNSDAAVAKMENLKKATEFIKETLLQIGNKAETDAFIRNYLKSYFPKFNNNDIKSLLKVYEKNSGTNEEDKIKKVAVPFNRVAEQVLQKYNLFTMRDTLEIYFYNEGVYRSEGTLSILDTIIRKIHDALYAEIWNEVNPEYPLGNIPAATIGFVNEVLAYIRSYTHIKREDITQEQNRYVNFLNGIFDLEEWKLKEHSPKIRIIGQLPVKYDVNARCPEIEKYLEACELTPENIKVLMEFAGYSMTADVKMQKALMLYGNGSNGKSVFINLLKTVIGKDYTSGETLQNLETDKYRVANLFGKRLNAFPDLKDTPLQQNEVFNTLTGNDLYLTGERKYQNAFDFKPTAKLLFSANKAPFAHSDNYAYYRRWILIKFPHTFEKSEINENLLESLTKEEEKSGLLNLMLEGLQRLYTNRKFSYDADVADIEKEYMLNADNVSVFEEQCLRDCSGNEEPTEKSRVYEMYLKWCETYKLPPMKTKTFTKKLDKAGRKVYNTTKYDGITKKGKWFSCYWNTVCDIDLDPAQTLLPVGSYAKGKIVKAVEEETNQKSYDSMTEKELIEELHKTFISKDREAIEKKLVTKYKFNLEKYREDSPAAQCLA